MLIFFIFSCVFVSTCQGIETPELIREQLESILRTNNVPNYDIVSTSYATHDNTLGTLIRVLQFTSFKRDIRLYLEPTNGFLAGKNTPIWTVRSDYWSPFNRKYTKVPNAMDDIVQIYQDIYNRAAITARIDKDGKIYFEGMIGNNLVVRQLPNELRKKFTRFKRNTYQENFRQTNRSVYHNNLQYANYHILIEIPETSIHGSHEKLGSYVPQKRSLRSKRETKIPETIFPQILVIVDYDIYLSFRSFIEFKQYILSFWNAVDLRYRVFVNPNVRLNIAGIIIPTDPNATPYLTNYRKQNSNGKAIIDADKALDHAGKYFYDEMTNKRAKRLVLIDDYDAIMIMTKADLCNRIVMENSDSHDCTTVGYSFRGGACTLNINESLVEAAGLVEDNAGYAGIVPAAHELGHLFGAPHDGRKEANKISCSPFDGYIMSRRLTFGENMFTWSYCSAEYLNDFFYSSKAECLFNQPNVGVKAPRIMPGIILSLDEQCDRIRSSYACNPDSSACTRLDCFDRNTRTCIPIAAAAEGSQCGIEQYCINGKCTNTTTSSILLSIASPPTLIN